MDTAESILAFLKNQGSSGSKTLCAHLGISRQALNRHLNRLIDEGKGTLTQQGLSFIRPEPHEHLADIAAGKQIHEGSRRLLDSVDDGLLPFHPA